MNYNLKSNRVLTPEDRVQLKPAVNELAHLCPEIMKRKFPDAVFQNAFIFEQVKNCAQKSDRIIVIGGYEDPIGPALQKLGFDVIITDPNLDKRDMDSVWRESILFGIEYDIVVCCSVLEHVEDDALFLHQMYQILKQNGKAFLTTDYCFNWHEGMEKPSLDYRLYSSQRLHALLNQLPQNSLLDPPLWDEIEPYFQFEKSKYAFCSIAFVKQAHNRFYQNEITRRFVYNQFEKNYMEKIEYLNYQIKELQTQLEHHPKLGAMTTAIAKRIQLCCTRFPNLCKLIKYVLKGLLFMKRKLLFSGT